MPRVQAQSWFGTNAGFCEPDRGFRLSAERQVVCCWTTCREAVPMRQISRFRRMIEFCLCPLLVVMLEGVSAPSALAQQAFVSNNGSGTVSVIDTTTLPPSVIATVNVGSFPNGVAISPDGASAYVANAGSGTVAVIDTTTLLVTPVPVGARPAWIAFTPDGTRAYVTNFGDTTVSVIDATAVPPSVLPPVQGLNHPFGIAVTPDGTRAYAANTDASRVSVIDTDPLSATYNTIVWTVDLGGSLPCQSSGIRSCPGVAVSPDGTRAYVTISGSNVVAVIDADRASPTLYSVIARVTVGNAPRGISFAPDGTRAYVTDSGVSSNNVSVIDTDPTSLTYHMVVAMVPVGDDPWGVAFTPDGTQAYVANFGGNTVSEIDTTSNPPVVVNIVTVGSAPLGVAITPF